MSDQYHKERLTASIKRVYREADTAYKVEVEGDYALAGHPHKAIEAMRQFGEDATTMHAGLFARCAVETTMTKVVDCSLKLEKYLIAKNLVATDQAYVFSNEIEDFTDWLKLSYLEGLLASTEGAVTLKAKMEGFLQERFVQLIGKPEDRVTPARSTLAEWLYRKLTGKSDRNLFAGRTALKKQLTSTEDLNAYQSLLNELDKAIVTAGNTLNKYNESQLRGHFLGSDKNQDIWAAAKAAETEKDEMDIADLEGVVGAAPEREASIRQTNPEAQQKHYHQLLDTLGEKRETAIKKLVNFTYEADAFNPPKTHFLMRFFGLILAPVALPVLAILGAVQSITSTYATEIWAWPLHYLNQTGLRLSAIQKLARLAKASADSEGEGKLEWSDREWDRLLQAHARELKNDFLSNYEDLGLTASTDALRLDQRDQLVKAISQVKSYDNHIHRLTQAYVDHVGVRADYVGARKTVRHFLNTLHEDDAEWPALDFKPSANASKVIASTKAMHAGRGVDEKGQTVGAVSLDLLQKRSKVNGIAAPGLASDKAKRSHLNTGLDALEIINPGIFGKIESNKEAHLLAKLYEKQVATVGISYKQSLIIRMAKVGAFLYALGCGLQIAAGIMTVVAFPGAPFVALAFGMLFTFTYNWWLSKGTLPQIMMGMFNGKKGIMHDLQTSHVGYWPWLMIKALVKGVLHTARVLAGIVFLPLVFVLTKGFDTLFRKSVYANAGAATYAFIMGWVFGLIEYENITDKSFQSTFDKEWRSDSLAWAMFGFLAIGTALIMTGTGPMVLGLLVIVAGIGCFVYKLTRGLAEYVDEQNQKKVMSNPRRFLLSLLFCLVLLMGFANGALVIPGIEAFKQVLAPLGLAAYAMVVAIPVMLGTIIAATALMLVSFADFLKKQNVLKNLKSFFVNTMWRGKKPKAKASNMAEQGIDSDANGANTDKWTWRGAVARTGSLVVVVAIGMWGIASLCLAMADSILQMSAVFAGGKELIAVALFIGMAGLFSDVLVILWKEMVAAASDPVGTLKSLKSAFANMIEWTYGPLMTHSDRFSAGADLNPPWYERCSAVEQIAMAFFFLPLFIVRKITINIIVTLVQLVVEIPLLIAEGFVRTFPTMFSLFMGAGAVSLTVSPFESGGEEGNIEAGNRNFKGLLKIRASLANFYRQFTRVGNNAGNGVLVAHSVQAAFNSPVVTIFSVAAAFINSFSALFITMRNEKVTKSINDAALLQIESGSTLSIVETKAKTGEVLEGADIRNALILEKTHKQSIFESIVLEKRANLNGNDGEPEVDPTHLGIGGFEGSMGGSGASDGGLEGNAEFATTFVASDLWANVHAPRHFFPQKGHKNIVEGACNQMLFKQVDTPNNTAERVALVRDTFGYEQEEAELWTNRCAALASSAA